MEIEDDKKLTPFKWNLLDPTFMLTCHSFINLCLAKNIVIEPLIGEVTLENQAKFYKRCKSKSDIEEQITLLRSRECNFLADILENTPTDDEQWTTDNIPGYCWHNWGKALKYQVKNFDLEKMYPYITSILDDMGQLKFLNYLDRTTGIGYIQLPTHHVSYLHDMNYINNHFKTKFEKNQYV